MYVYICMCVCISAFSYKRSYVFTLSAELCTHIRHVVYIPAHTVHIYKCLYIWMRLIAGMAAQFGSW